MELNKVDSKIPTRTSRKMPTHEPLTRAHPTIWIMETSWCFSSKTESVDVVTLHDALINSLDRELSLSKSYDFAKAYASHEMIPFRGRGIKEMRSWSPFAWSTEPTSSWSRPHFLSSSSAMRASTSLSMSHLRTLSMTCSSVRPPSITSSRSWTVVPLR